MPIRVTALAVLLGLTGTARASAPGDSAPLPPPTGGPLEIINIRLSLDTRVYGRFSEWESSQGDPDAFVDHGGPSFAGVVGFDVPSARAFAIGFSLAAGSLPLRFGCDSGLCGVFALDLSFAPRIRLAVARTWELYVAGQVGLSILQGFEGSDARWGPHVAQLIGFQKVLSNRRSVYVEAGWHGYWHFGFFESSYTSHLASVRLGFVFGFGPR
ncbi:MAG: hypothetical protein R3F39_14595 [Myxococcota bacterium]